MANRRLNRAAAAFKLTTATLALSTLVLATGCGGIPAGSLLPGGNNTGNNNDNSNPDDAPGFTAVVPETGASVSDLANAFVISVPLTGANGAGTAAGQFTTLAAPLTAPGWGSSAIGFDVGRTDWADAVTHILTEANERGGVVKIWLKPLDVVSPDLVAANADLPPAAGMSTVGVLPIILLTTPDDGYPSAGVGMNVELWSQRTNAQTGVYDSATRYYNEALPLLSSIETRRLRENGLWNSRLLAIIPKTGVWWARSEGGAAPVRNWMKLSPVSTVVSQVRCLTDAGLWP